MAEALQRAARPDLPPWLAGIERATALTPSGLTVAALAVLAWLLAFTIGSRVLFLMVYGTVLLLVVLAATGRRRVGITAERSTLPTRVREGQPVSVALSIERKGRVGTVVLEESLSRLAEPVRLLVSEMPAGAPATYEYSFTPRLRGDYPVGPLVAIVSDPFGLTRKRQTLIPPANVIVHPSTEQVHDRVLSREWEDPPVRPPVSKPWPTGFEFYGMRDYVPGDDPRRIVWRATARTGRYLVREAEQGITDRVTILFDTDAKHHAKGDPSETFETAVRAVASLARLHLSEGFVVSIETPSEPVARGLRGQRELMRMLDQMARVQPAHVPLAGALRRAITDPRRDTHTIVVSPRLERDAAAALKLLVDRGGSISFVHVQGEDEDDPSTRRAASIGCEVVELRPGAPLEAMFRRATGAGLRR